MVSVAHPAGVEELEVVEVAYLPLATGGGRAAARPVDAGTSGRFNSGHAMDKDLASWSEGRGVDRLGEALREANETLVQALARARARAELAQRSGGRPRAALDALIERCPPRHCASPMARPQHAAARRRRSSAASTGSRAPRTSRRTLLEAVALLDAPHARDPRQGATGGVERIAVMAALNIANELLRERKKPSAGGRRPIDGPANAA